MEDNEKSGYTAEGRKLRPRRPRSSERAYSSSDNFNSGDGERKSFGERRSYGGPRREGGERRSYGEGGRPSYGRSGGFGGRRDFHGSSEGRRFSSDGERREGGFEKREGGERRSYGEGGRPSFGRSNGGFGGRRDFHGHSDDRRPFRRDSDGEQTRRFSSDGEKREGGYEKRSYGEGGRPSYGRSSGGFGGRRDFHGHSDDRRPFRRDSDGEGRRFSSEGRRFSSDGDRRGGFRQGGKSFGSYGRGAGRSDRRNGGFGKPSYRFDDENSGIMNMVNSHPQVTDAQIPEGEAVQTAFKEEMRLNKYIANSGVCSRREADQMIQAGVVTVNGEVVTELGTKVNVLKDEIKFNGETLKGETKVYIVMNKPKGYVTSASDSHADKLVMDLLKGCEYRVFPVGRLDKNTTGVLMLTNDGDIAEKLTHPSYDKKKIYQVILDHPVSEEDRDKILSGITLNDGDVKADSLEYIDAEDHRKMGIEIHSGKNRIVRRIFESLGYDVKALDRVYFAGLTKKGLKKGEWRYLTEGESNILKMGAYL
jgi:23S rRNA pseudouridine2605 synthase